MEQYWTIAPKSGPMVRFRLKRAQRILDAEYGRQMQDVGFVRINVLKMRQLGSTAYWTARALHRCMFWPGTTALTLAHEIDLPAVWLRRERAWYEQTPQRLRPTAGATNRTEMWFNRIGSRHYIGSAKGGFPGMGDTIQFLHLSEIGSWDKSPVLIDPDKVLLDLKPALPTGADIYGTVIIRESTGKVRGDWWYRAWQAGKDKDNEYTNVFLPWFLQEEYRRNDLETDVTGLSDYEQGLLKIAQDYGIELSKGQLAWRRHEIRQDPYFGEAEKWAPNFPATEQEAFSSPGLSVFSAGQVAAARGTCRVPMWLGDILVPRNPADYKLHANPGGPLAIWEPPDHRYHYVVGADCRWGTRETSDWDVAYAECLETKRVVARIWGKFDLALWGRLLAALGYHYNCAPLAPERNALAATVLMPLLLGNVADWRYPNVWVRTDDVKLKGHRPQDFGWLTDMNSKGDLIAYAKAATIEGAFDWCDSLAVDEMEAWIHDEKLGNPTAPKGSNDDCLMGRMITAYVAHRERFRTDLYVPPKPVVYTFRSQEERVAEMINPREAGT